MMCVASKETSGECRQPSKYPTRVPIASRQSQKTAAGRV